MEPSGASPSSKITEKHAIKPVLPLELFGDVLSWLYDKHGRESKQAILSFMRSNQACYRLGLKYLYRKISLGQFDPARQLVDSSLVIQLVRENNALEFVRELAIFAPCNEWTSDLRAFMKDLMPQIRSLVLSWRSKRFLDEIWPMLKEASCLRHLHVHSRMAEEQTIPKDFGLPSSLKSFNVMFVVDSASSAEHLLAALGPDVNEWKCKSLPLPSALTRYPAAASKLRSIGIEWEDLPAVLEACGPSLVELSVFGHLIDLDTLKPTIWHHLKGFTSLTNLSLAWCRTSELFAPDQLAGLSEIRPDIELSLDDPFFSLDPSLFDRVSAAVQAAPIPFMKMTKDFLTTADLPEYGFWESLDKVWVSVNEPSVRDDEEDHSDAYSDSEGGFDDESDDEFDDGGEEDK